MVGNSEAQSDANEGGRESVINFCQAILGFTETNFQSAPFCHSVFNNATLRRNSHAASTKEKRFFTVYVSTLSDVAGVKPCCRAL